MRIISHLTGAAPCRAIPGTLEYPIPSGMGFHEFQISIEENFAVGGFLPVYKLRPVNSYEEYLFSIKGDEYFLFGEVSPVPAGFIMKPVEPPIPVCHYAVFPKDRSPVAEELMQFVIQGFASK